MFEDIKSLLKQILNINKYNYVAIGYEKITVNGTVKSLTVPANARYAEFKLESADSGIAARHLLTGANPTTTDGIGISDSDMFDVTGTQNLSNFKIIRVQSGTTTLHVQYYK